ncbi:MAG: phage terminase large subunit, partial [Rhodobacterales bacterium]|nr:phage terminase large subunit [Rhodobacterales bacterium]
MTATFPEFVWLWTERQGQALPDLHLRIARWLEARWRGGDRELLLMAFRNSGKSTLVGLFCAWLLLERPDLRILVMAADLALARKMVRNVKRVIERHPLTGPLKPPRLDQWASDQFTVNRAAEWRDPSMLAKGIGANVTGSRADVVICDDVEVPNTCDTPAKRQDLRARLAELDYVLVPGGTQLYVGTPHAHASIYAADPPPGEGEGEGRDRPFLDGFHRLVLPILNDAGHSRWPERFPAERIARIRRRTGPNKFASQLLLQPVPLSDGRLDADLVKLYDDDLDYRPGNGESVLRIGEKRLVSASCWWDPAFGAPGRGDASVIAAVYSCAQGHAWLHRVAYLTHDPALARTGGADAASQLCAQVADFVAAGHLPSVTVETNGLGRFLPGLLRRVLAERVAAGRGGPCAVIETASTRSKDLRILEAFDAILAAGRLHAHRSVWATPLPREMREWRP